MTETNFTYGPSRPDHPYGHQDFTTPSYLSGYANKIIYDLEKKVRMYDGHLAKIFRPSQSDRCPTCTDTITGAIVLSSCPTCDGSGTVNGFEEIAEQWVLINFGPKKDLETEFGNTENMNAGTDQFIIVGATMLKDQDLLITVDVKEVYKINQVEPQLVAMKGIIITQVAGCTYLTPGSLEYNLIDW